MIDGAVLISRDDDGTIHVKETGDHDVFKGSAIGIGAGLVVGLFALLLLGAMVVGGLIGGITGKLVKHHQEKGIEKDVEDTIPPGTSGIVAVFEDSGWTRSSASLTKPPRRHCKEADKETAKELKAALKAEEAKA